MEQLVTFLSSWPTPPWTLSYPHEISYMPFKVGGLSEESVAQESLAWSHLSIPILTSTWLVQSPGTLLLQISSWSFLYIWKEEDMIEWSNRYACCSCIFCCVYNRRALAPIKKEKLRGRALYSISQHAMVMLMSAPLCSAASLNLFVKWVDQDCIHFLYLHSLLTFISIDNYLILVPLSGV